MHTTTASFIQNRQVWANIPVKDVEKTRDFYSNLGFKINGDRNNEQLISFFVGDVDFVVHFFREEMFEQSSGGKAADLKNGKEAAVNGVMTSKDGKQYAFCDIYKFTGFKDPKISEMTSYVVEVG